MKTYEIKDIAAMFSVSEHVVKSWIRNGSLKAINICRKVSIRKKWRISEEQLQEFQESRTTKQERPRKIRQTLPVVPDLFPDCR